MAIEIAFGQGLGNRRYMAPTILASRDHEELPEFSLRAFACGLRDLLEGMARDCSDFMLARDGERFYFLLIVRPPTLALDLPQTVTFTVDRTRRLTLREQMASAAAQIACRLSDLGTPAWLEHEPSSGPRQPARLAAEDLY